MDLLWLEFWGCNTDCLTCCWLEENFSWDNTPKLSLKNVQTYDLASVRQQEHLWLQTCPGIQRPLNCLLIASQSAQHSLKHNIDSWGKLKHTRNFSIKLQTIHISIKQWLEVWDHHPFMEQVKSGQTSNWKKKYWLMNCCSGRQSTQKNSLTSKLLHLLNWTYPQLPYSNWLQVLHISSSKCHYLRGSWLGLQQCRKS